jgi:type IV pilus assembly protein PilW
MNTDPLQFSRHTPSKHAGFTLVEIMVGLVIGLLATIVIMQVFSVFEAQKRTTTGTADAQVNGSIALFTITRDLQVAGYPLMPSADSPLKCTTLTSGAGATGITNIAPVTIVDGGVGGSDSLTVRYGNSAFGGAPTLITALPVGNDVTVENNLGCQPNDITVISNGPTCALSSASAVTGTVAPFTITMQDITGAVVGAKLACLGTWNNLTYAVNQGNLEQNGRPIITGIVNLQVRYGISDTRDSNQVTDWVDATTANGWDNPSVDNRNRIKAVRIAVVARNAKMEPTAVTTNLSSWVSLTAASAPAIDLSADTNWQRYRYRVFETIVPLRNVIWSRDVLL